MAESSANHIQPASAERQPNLKEKLGFIPLSGSEKGRAVKLYEAYQEDNEKGVARYFARIASKSKGGGARAAAAVFRNEVIANYKNAINHQDIMQGATVNKDKLGEMFTNNGPVREVITPYLKANQKQAGVPDDEIVSIDEFVNEAKPKEIEGLAEEVFSNAVLRENFWHIIISLTRGSYQMLDKIAVTEGIPNLNPVFDVTATAYRRGTIEDPDVSAARYLDDKGRR